MILFLSGPMTGLPDYNRAEFNRVAALLGATPNMIVLNPAVLPDGMSHDKYLHICKAMIDAADCVAALPGWEISRGANEERDHALAKHTPWFPLINPRPDLFNNDKEANT